MRLCPCGHKAKAPQVQAVGLFTMARRKKALPQYMKRRIENVTLQQ